VSDDVAEQTKTCMERLKIVLEQAGMDFSDVVRGTVFLADINDYAAMNKVYASYFKKDPPARACVQVARLVRDAKVEISMIAIKTE
jgi:2-iminobutanoate/2-iminopropanoate deaminase